MKSDSESLVDRVAQAIYKTQVKQAREIIDQIEFEAKELPDLFLRLKDESETAQVLVFGSYLEDRVFSLIKARMLHMKSKKIEDSIFGSNGPLDNFGSRITLSYHLGWLSTANRSKLDAFRKIRNEFAHRAFKISFKNKNIADHFKRIDYDVSDFLKPIRESFTKIGDSDPFISSEDITTEQKYLCSLAILAARTFSDYLILPTAIAYQVNPKI